MAFAPYSRLRRRLVRAVAIAGLLVLPGLASAREVTVPVRLDTEFLRQTLVTQVYTQSGQSMRVWDDGSGCNFLVLSNPRVATGDGVLRVISDGVGRIGTAVGNSCLTLVDWKGRVEVDEQPTLAPDQPVVHFRIVDSNLYAESGRKQVTGTLWDWVKSYVHPRLEAVTVDLHQPVEELRAFLPLVLSDDAAGSTQALLASLHLESARATDAGLQIDVAFSVGDPIVGPPAPEPTLTPEELAAWQAAWQQWDAFITFVLKQSASDTPVDQERRALFEVLIAARYDLVEALAPSAPHSADPVRPLFLKTWARLAPVLRQLSLGVPGETALRYLSFITAADALRALDDLGPDVGVDISADGLRRLARMVAPATSEDPLAWDEAVDPRLRELFGFGAPLPPPEDNPDVDPTPGVVATGPAGWRSALRFAPGHEPRDYLEWIARWLSPPPAYADLDPRLKSWVPSRDDLPIYLPLVRDLLLDKAAATLAKEALEARFHPLYRNLVLATAWKESCWRQFVRVGGNVRPMTSPAGAVGIMQVLPRVWRGFYEVKGLHQDIGYNAAAGSEILLHYLRDYAIKKGEHTATGELDNLARATYAVYNGGPGHLRRYRKERVSRSLRRIDESFWEKYLKVKKGNELAVAECYGP